MMRTKMVPHLASVRARVFWGVGEAVEISKTDNRLTAFSAPGRFLQI